MRSRWPRPVFCVQALPVRFIGRTPWFSSVQNGRTKRFSYVERRDGRTKRFIYVPSPPQSILLLAIYPCIATGLTKKLAMFNHAVNSFSKKYVKKFSVYYIKKKNTLYQ
jgi:hypothetical protein